MNSSDPDADKGNNIGWQVTMQDNHGGAVISPSWNYCLNPPFMRASQFSNKSICRKYVHHSFTSKEWYIWGIHNRCYDIKNNVNDQNEAIAMEYSDGELFQLVS